MSFSLFSSIFCYQIWAQFFLSQWPRGELLSVALLPFAFSVLSFVPQIPTRLILPLHIITCHARPFSHWPFNPFRSVQLGKVILFVGRSSFEFHGHTAVSIDFLSHCVLSASPYFYGSGRKLVLRLYSCHSPLLSPEFAWK